MSFLASELDQEFSVEHPAFQVRLRTHRRTVLVQLFGELDLVTVPRVAVALDGINLEADGYRHVVLDLSGLTFMDATGIHELIRQSNHANQNQHNLAVVRGPASISRLMSMTDADTQLVLIDSLEDLLPPLTTTPLKIDTERNETASGDVELTADGALTRKLVMQAREDLEIATQTRTMLE